MVNSIVNLIGLILVGLTIWWFLLKRPKETKATEDTLSIVVQDGIYTPSLIRAKSGQTLTLSFLRKDTTPCSEFVVFDQLNISGKLPINKPYIIKVVLKEPGEYDFTCQMGMYRGKLIVE
ncbi:MAG TPA: cupredoxin domain-containing protein [Gammaproteobacteria bacterium]|nr:cupredoxin domain-containing protein [Gammaproteobacteria bacterium]